ncbi:MAG: sugar phosphate isomerase/epimerase family protein [Flavobacteriaceae bacterium]|nr:sugar phosphate isomerase/epimerase [Flavobacteriia bacterium]
MMKPTLALLLISLFISCQNPKKETPKQAPFFKLSLAQWSFNKSFRSGEVSPYEFAKMASELGFEGLEYVNQLYPDVMESEDKAVALDSFVAKNNRLAQAYNMKNVLIMIDSEGDLASSDESVRQQAVTNHKMWVDTANKMGCSAIRLNLFGEKDPEKWVANSITSLKELAAYASDKSVNVIVENHGRLSSNIPVLMQVIEGVGMKNCGTLPDFGNFCIAEEGYGSLFDGSCKEFYDPYQGVSEMISSAFGVSAKSYDFNEEGNETTLDYNKLIGIVKEAGYKGYIGVEYEGNRLSEEEGVKATKKLLEQIASTL